MTRKGNDGEDHQRIRKLVSRGDINMTQGPKSRFPTSEGKRPPQGQRLRAIIVKDPAAPHYALVRAHDAFVIATAKSPEFLGQMARERGYPPSETRLYDEGPAPQSSKAVHDACAAGIKACEAAREIEAQSLLEVRDIKDAAFDAVAADRDLTAKAAQLDAAGVSKEPLHNTAYARASLIKDPTAPPGAENKYVLVQEGRVIQAGRGTMELSIWAAQNGYGIVNDMNDRAPQNPSEAADYQAAQEAFSRAKVERLANHPEMQADTTLALGGPSVGQDMDLWAASQNASPIPKTPEQANALAQLDADFDRALRARDEAHASLLDASPENMADRLREYRAATDALDVAQLKAEKFESDLEATHILGEGGPEASPGLGIEPPTPSNSPGSSDAAQAEIPDGPTESSDQGPSDTAVVDGPDLPGPVAPGPENSIEAIAAVTAHMDRGAMEAAGWSRARITAAISSRTFPDAHRAAAEASSRAQIQRGSGHSKKAQKVASKTLKRKR